ncbi:phospholipid scramblase-related protein [Hydrogenophaga sp. PAMC20947]|uniref:LURP-one-related/scramblase family protein n=1 Tax=Hydrogenophaga sp. PAMC20947 TaxID=2565558 RepID=UPI00109E0A09|nr:phospholipid scramblase-related protein [Hydrogenophaga sp. PAMC20947]QCB47461.1 RNAase [Hydrogenophaga sp. PAMC20947]
MHASLQNNQFFVKEHVGLFKAANNYDIHDPASQLKVLECREPDLGIFTKIFRFTDYKRMTPFSVEIRTPEGQLVLTVKRGLSLILSTVDVLDENNRVVGHFKQKLFSIGGKFDVLDAQKQVVCTLRGKWTSWDFRFMRGEAELASVTKKWMGVGKELFTSADNYVLSIAPSVAPNDPTRLLILAAVMCIDMVLKE